VDGEDPPGDPALARERRGCREPLRVELRFEPPLPVAGPEELAAELEHRAAAKASSDLEYTSGLPEPPQQQVLPSPPAWAPAPGAERNAAPVIEHFWPDKAHRAGGQRVVIQGQHLEAAAVVFGFVPAQIVDETAFSVTVIAPPGSDEVPIVLTNRDGNYSVASARFRYF
jgi:hypothetical protein